MITIEEKISLSRHAAQMHDAAIASGYGVMFNLFLLAGSGPFHTSRQLMYTRASPKVTLPGDNYLDQAA